jgi:hypothetical protein
MALPHLIHITSFRFDRASYLVKDGAGDDVRLEVDYKNNRFQIVSLGGPSHSAYRREIRAIATGLLARKHGIDFADKSSPPA